MAGPNRVFLNGESARKRDEANAAGTIYPGDLIQHDVNGNVVVHSNPYGGGELMIAIEDGVRGRMVDDFYVSGDKVFFHRPMRGDVFWMRLKANGGTASPITDVASAGDGTVIVTGGGTGAFPLKLRTIESVPQAGAVQRVRIRVT